MTKHVIVWDLETIPDLQALRSVHEFAGSDDELESEVTEVHDILSVLSIHP